MTPDNREEQVLVLRELRVFANDRSTAALDAAILALERQGVATDHCPYCGAPCRKEVLMRGGEHGWGDDDSRTVYRYAALGAKDGR